MERITKAVELDDLTPIDEFVQHSSSAVDIKTVLVQIKTFWTQLSWPDVEASYAFISKILDVSYFDDSHNSLPKNRDLPKVIEILRVETFLSTLCSVLETLEIFRKT